MKAYIPYGGYWSTPFCKWQGALAHLHSFEIARLSAEQALAARGLDLAAVDSGVLGLTVPQKGCFYGLPWLAGQLGAGHLAGPTIMQACATGGRIVAHAEAEVGRGAGAVLAIATDRVSNGPHLYYPAPGGPGGTGQSEDWVLGNFERDPYARVSMVQTAENVAARFGLSTEEQHALVLRRFEQYRDALADDRAFQKRYMVSPFTVPAAKGRATTGIDGDQGITETSADRLAQLKPVLPEGTITFGGQTHPADGAAGMLVASEAKAREMSADPGITISIVAFGQAREEPGYMPAAPIPAARQALERAGLSIDDMTVIKSHNPFIVNDLAFARSFGIDPFERMNNFGCSLVWGHPQGPTGLRALIEMIEELVLRGGGHGLFHGCAAGDTALACILKVEG
jgi:acetyl-CoA C-acetyltransferase